MFPNILFCVFIFFSCFDFYSFSASSTFLLPPSFLFHCQLYFAPSSFLFFVPFFQRPFPSLFLHCPSLKSSSSPLRNLPSLPITSSHPSFSPLPYYLLTPYAPFFPPSFYPLHPHLSTFRHPFARSPFISLPLLSISPSPPTTLPPPPLHLISLSPSLLSPPLPSLPGGRQSVISRNIAGGTDAKSDPISM